MGNDQYFEKLDEIERTYAPEELSPDDPESARVRADPDAEAVNTMNVDLPPRPAPVASIGSSPSGGAAPANLGNEYRGGGQGDPETQARNPVSPNDVDDVFQVDRRNSADEGSTGEQ